MCFVVLCVYRSLHVVLHCTAQLLWLICSLGWVVDKGDLVDVLVCTQTFVTGQCLLHTWQT